MAVLAVAALVAGCGDGGGGDGGSDRLTKSEFEQEYRAAADRVSRPRIDDGGLDTPQEAAAAFTEARKRVLRFASEIERLRPPAEIEQAHRDYIASLRATAEDMKPLLALLRRGDEAGAKRILDRPTSFASPRTIELVRRGRAGFQAKGYDIRATLEGVAP